MRQIWISVDIDKNNNIIDNAQCPHAWTLIKITKYGLVWTLIQITHVDKGHYRVNSRNIIQNIFADMSTRPA